MGDHELSAGIHDDDCALGIVEPRKKWISLAVFVAVLVVTLLFTVTEVSDFCPVREATRVPVSIFLLTATTSASLAYGLGHVHIFPIELSLTANRSPSYWILSGGLSLTACLIFFTYPRPDSLLVDVLVILACVGMVGLGWISDRYWQKAHQLCGVVCFASLLCVGLLRAGRRGSYASYAGVAFYAVHELSNLRLEEGSEARMQVHGLTQWCTIASLLLAL